MFRGNRNEIQLSFGTVVRKLLLAWILAAAAEFSLHLGPLSDLSTLAGMSLLRLVVLTAAIFLAALIFHKHIPAGFERWAMVFGYLVIAVLSLLVSYTPAFLCVCCLILAILTWYALRGWNADSGSKCAQRTSSKLWIGIGAVLAISFFLFVSIWTVCRVYSFCTPTYDFGIFSQMFYNMKETGLPVTTVERDGLLSHFAVHVSPIYYLMLPFYWLFPTPATLQVLQALVITSSVIPLWKIGKHHGLSEAQRMLICVLLLLYPAFSGGTSYDIHENCFLTPLILWTLYGIDKKNWIMTAIAGILTLMVKEDAAVYVAVIALWLTVKTILRFKELDKKNLLSGIVMLAVSIGWFLVVTKYLADHGDGVMTSRYSNFMYDGSSSLTTVIKSMILNPMKAIYECVDAEKLKFIAMTLLPLLGLPLITRRYERYILLIPYILVNLMSDYQYQHDIFFQYTFGSTAFLLYLTVINLADFKINWKRISVLAVAVIISAVYFCTVVLPVGIQYPIQAIQYQEYYQNIRDTLDTIPEGSSVAATTFYTTYLSQREILYDIKYCSKEHLLETQYVVLKVNSNSDCKKYATNGKDNGYENLVQLLEESGYQKYGADSNVLVIYKKQ